MTQCVGCKREFCSACGDALECSGVLTTETIASDHVSEHKGLRIEDMPDEILMHIMEAEVAKTVPPLPVSRQAILNVLPQRFAEAKRRAAFLMNVKRISTDKGHLARIANDWTLWRHVWRALPQPMRVPLCTPFDYQSAVVESMRRGCDAMKVWPQILANQPRRFSSLPTSIDAVCLSMYFLLLPDDTNNQNSHVTHLHAHDNKLVALPAEIGRLTTLKYLGLQHNQLQVLPAEIGRLTALQIFDLQHNQLQALPDEIGQLTALKRLYLSNNRLQALPDEIGQLTVLRYLKLHDNRLHAFPIVISMMTALRTLDLERNQLQSLPTEIGHLTALRKLHLENNQLYPLTEQTVLVFEMLRLADVRVHD